MTVQESSLVHQRIDSMMKSEASRERIAEIRSVLVLSTLWYTEIISGLKTSLRDFFKSLDVDEKKLHFVDVPGALELPYAARVGALGRLIGQKSAPDLMVVLGCVQRGSTPHFDYVCSTAFDGLMDVQLQQKIPMGYGLLTVDDLNQAHERISKGFEAAQAALFMYLSTEKTKVEVE